MTEEVEVTKKRPYNRKSAEPMEMQAGQDNPRDMPMDGDAMITAPVIEVVGGPGWKDKAKALAFNEEVLDIVVHETTDENADPYPFVAVNGIRQFFDRGTQQQVKRKFVEALVRSKGTKYSQRNAKDSQGNDVIRHDPHTALRHPFSVIHDPNPNGLAWLRKIMAEA